MFTRSQFFVHMASTVMTPFSSEGWLRSGLTQAQAFLCFCLPIVDVLKRHVNVPGQPWNTAEQQSHVDNYCSKFSEENTQIQLPALFFQADTGMAIWRVHKGTQWLYDRYSNWIYEILYFNTTTTEPNTKVIEKVKWDGLLFRRFAVSNHHLRTVTRSQTHMMGKNVHLKCEMLYF